MITQRPRDMAPSRIASARLCSCTISFHKLYGVSLSSTRNEPAKITMPIAAYTTAFTTLLIWMLITCLPCSGGKNCKLTDTIPDCRVQTWERSALHQYDSGSSRDIPQSKPHPEQQFRKPGKSSVSFVVS